MLPLYLCIHCIERSYRVSIRTVQWVTIFYLHRMSLISLLIYIIGQFLHHLHALIQKFSPVI